MQFGHFDDKRKEYVVTNPATPKSWSNYLGDTRYGAIITNNAGGYSFYRSSVQGCFLRLKFNTVPNDQPGRYIYLHDLDSKDFWSGSWQPVGKPLDKYKSECRHGSAYTIISSEYEGIKTETLYFVPLGQEFEVWRVKVTNNSGKKRNLRAFTYAEFASNWNMHDDSNNLQYTQYIIKTSYADGFIDHGNNLYMPEEPDNFQNKDQARHSFIGVVGQPVTGYDSDRDKFIGLYHTYANPESVVKGQCGNTVTEGDNGCGTLQVDLTLEAGETKEFTVVLGIGKAWVEGKKAAEIVASPAKVEAEYKKVVDYWVQRPHALKVGHASESRRECPLAQTKDWLQRLPFVQICYRDWVVDEAVQFYRLIFEKGLFFILKGVYCFTHFRPRIAELVEIRCVFRLVSHIRQTHHELVSYVVLIVCDVSDGALSVLFAVEVECSCAADVHAGKCFNDCRGNGPRTGHCAVFRVSIVGCVTQDAEANGDV